MDQRDDLRASDADRQAVGDILRNALDEGRLDLHEYDERLQRAYAAKTYADLKGLLTDLPATVDPGRSQVAQAPPVAAPSSATPTPASGLALRQWLLAIWGAYLKVVAVTVAIWLATSLVSGANYFWPIWVAGPWGAVLLVSTVSGQMGGGPRRWHGPGHSGPYAAGRVHRGC